MSLFQRLNREFEGIGKRAQVALEEGKLQLELLRLRRQRDNAARDLGMLVHRRERTGEAEPRRIESLLVRIDDLEQAIARVQRELAASRGETVSVDDGPAPAHAESADASDAAASAESHGAAGTSGAAAPGVPPAPPPPPPPQPPYPPPAQPI